MIRNFHEFNSQDELEKHLLSLEGKTSSNVVIRSSHFGDSISIKSTQSLSNSSDNTSKPLKTVTSNEPSSFAATSDDFYGWFDDDIGFENADKSIRDALVKLAEEIYVDNNTFDTKSEVLDHVKTSYSSTYHNQIDHESYQGSVLYSWNNPNPSLSLKLSSNTLKDSLSYGLKISSCVSGIRIRQYNSGVIRAEFNYIFCYGSSSYSSWKSYSEFKELAEIITKINNRRSKNLNFAQTLRHWQLLEDNKRWFRCLNISYLVKKSLLLGQFMESLLMESPSPGLILAFVHTNSSEK